MSDLSDLLLDLGLIPPAQAPASKEHIASTERPVAETKPAADPEPEAISPEESSAPEATPEPEAQAEPAMSPKIMPRAGGEATLADMEEDAPNFLSDTPLGYVELEDQTDLPADLPEYDRRLEVAATSARPIGTLFVQDDEVWVQLADRIEMHDVDARHLPRIKHLIKLRDAARAVLNAELAGVEDKELEKLRGEMNEVYDSFVATFGAINTEPVGKRASGRRVNLVGFEGDPDVHFVAALEQPLPEGAGWEKAEIFHRAVVRPVEAPTSAESPEDALLLSLDHRGKVDLEWMAGLLDSTVEQVKNDLKGQIFQDPENCFIDRDPQSTSALEAGTGVEAIKLNSDARPGRYVLHDRGAADRSTWTITWISPSGKRVKSEVKGASAGAQQVDFATFGISVETNGSYRPGQLQDKEILVQAKWEHADVYLAGRVKRKLRVAQEMGEVDPAYQDNTAALQQVQPRPLTKDEIIPSLGAPWISPNHIQEFVASLFGRSYAPIQIDYLPLTGAWKVRFTGQNQDAATFLRGPVNLHTYGTEHLPLLPDHRGAGGGASLLEAVLNNREIRIRTATQDGRFITDGMATAEALDRLHDLREAFAKWVWQSQSRTEELVKAYNEQMNDWVPPRFRHEHKSFPGMSQAISLDPHQRRAVARIEINGNTLLAHEVGTGKTYIMGAAAMEGRRLGRMRKPAIVVPNNRLHETAVELQRLYPNARIMVAGGGSVSRKQWAEMAARISTTNTDIVIMPHQTFSAIRLSPQARLEIARHRLAELREAKVSFLEAHRRAHEAQVRKMTETVNRLEAEVLEAAKEGGVFFDQLGIDSLFIDEAHAFKNISVTTKNRALGVGKGSAMADDLVEKLSYIDMRTPGRNAVLATGTPVANSISEVYTYQMMLAPKRMHELNLANFDNWVNTFAEAAPEYEITASGLFRPKTRLRKFRNIGDLVAMFGEFADIVEANHLAMDRPEIEGGEPVVKTAKGGKVTREIIEHNIQRAEALERGEKLVPGDSLFRLMADSNRVAIDPRLLDPSHPDEPENKVSLVAREVAQWWHETKEERGVILVFMDQSTLGKGEGDWSFYPALREKLVELGVEPSSIGIVQEAKSDRAKSRLFQSAREGRVRVLIGSTQTLGTGANVQDRVYAIIHADVPWRPDAILQRNGRGHRRGNRYKKLKVVFTITEGSIEAFRAQRVFDKATVLHQLNATSRGDRVVDDTQDDLVYTASALRAAASGDPRVKRLHQLQREVSDLARRMGTEERSREEARRFIREYPMTKAYFESVVARLEEATAHLNASEAEGSETQDGLAESSEAPPDLFAATDASADVKEEAGVPSGGAAGRSAWDFMSWARRFYLSPESATVGSIADLIGGAEKFRKSDLDEPLSAVTSPRVKASIVAHWRDVANRVRKSSFTNNPADFLGPVLVRGVPLVFKLGNNTGATGQFGFIVSRTDINGSRRPQVIWGSEFIVDNTSSVTRAAEGFVSRTLREAVASHRRQLEDLGPQLEDWKAALSRESETPALLRERRRELDLLKFELGLGDSAEDQAVRRALMSGLIEEGDEPTPRQAKKPKAEAPKAAKLG